MANIDQPRGFELIGYKNGKINGSINPYYVPSSGTIQLVVGDPVSKVGGSNSTLIHQGSLYRIGTLPEINRTSIGSFTLIGIITGFAPLPDKEDIAEYNPIGVERVVFVSDDPDALYRAQFHNDDTTGTNNVGLNLNYEHPDTPDIVNGHSAALADAETFGTSPSLQFKFERYEGTDSNFVGEVNSKGIFSINNHQGVPHTLGAE